MKEVKTKLGILFVEEMTDEREEGRIKIYDSDNRYLDYVPDEDLDYDAFIEELQTIEDMREMLNHIGVSWHFFSLEWKDAAAYFRAPGVADYDSPESLLTNELVNRIGNAYIVINEC